MGAAQAQAFLPFTGFAPLPSFAWDRPTLEPGGVRWDGSYARISTGFQVSSSKRLGTNAGPTFGLEAGTMRQEGNFVYGIVGALEYMPAIGGYGTPSFGNVAYTRDFAGAFQVKAGVLVTPEVLLYTKVGMSAANETLRYRRLVLLGAILAQRHRGAAGGERRRRMGGDEQSHARPGSRRRRPGDPLRV